MRKIELIDVFNIIKLDRASFLYKICPRILNGSHKQVNFTQLFAIEPAILSIPFPLEFESLNKNVIFL